MPAKPRKKPPPQTTNDYLTILEHAIRKLSYGHHTFTIFRHFVELSAIALSNVADPINKAAREAQYLAIVKQYKPEEVQQFPPMLGMLVACLEQETTDVLGRLYHRLEIHNHQSGQFFTPYPLCQAMAKMLVHDAKRLGGPGVHPSTRNPVWAVGRWSLRSPKPYKRKVSTTSTSCM